MDKSVIDSLPEMISQDPTDELLGIYQSLFYENAYDSEAEKLAGVEEEKYLSELITWTINPTTNSFTISIIGESEQQVKDILDYYISKIEGTINESVNLTTKHKLTSANNMAYKSVDQLLVTEQKTVDDTMISLRASIAKARNDQKLLVKPVEPVNSVENKGFIKYAIIGILLGGFLSVAFYIVRYAMNAKVRNEDDLQHMYGIPLYGAIPNVVTRNPRNGIDKRIEKRRNRKNKADRDIICEQIAGLIRANFAEKKVLLASTSNSEEIQQVYEKLKGLLGSRCLLSVVQGFLSKTDSVNSSNDADAIILVEIRNESRLIDVDRMGEMLDISKANVAGYIIL